MKWVFFACACLMLAACAAAGVAEPSGDDSLIKATASPATQPVCAFSFTPIAFVGDDSLATPDLIDAAVDKGFITADERILLFAYAFFEPESLPTAFRSQIGWSGTEDIAELYSVIKSADFCVLPECIQAELRRLMTGTATCNSR